MILLPHEKAPTTQAGGKARVADQLVALIPPGREYREPFCGSAAVFFEVRRRGLFEEFWLNDLDAATVAFLTALRDDGDELTDSIMSVRNEFADERGAHEWARPILSNPHTEPFWMGVAYYLT